jgi:ubiquinone/menaquinone biosynthesis C-methylase UbiE/acyl carrier protein
MAYQSSYKINDFSSSTKNEIKRLNAQVELFWKQELSIYKTIGLKDGMSIVECGCGTGIVGRNLIQAFPNCQITAFDIDPFLVETARENAEQWELSNYEVHERSILDTGLPSGTYDVAIARLVLEHLSTPVDAIKEISRILKPGGKAIFVDNDFEYHMRTYPDIPELKDLYDAYCQARQDDGGRPKIGRELPTLLHSSGFSDIDLHIVGAHSGVLGDSMFLKSEGSGIPAKLVSDGYLPSDTYLKIAKKWNELLRTKGHSIFRQLFLCVGKKSAEQDGEYGIELASESKAKHNADVHVLPNVSQRADNKEGKLRRVESGKSLSVAIDDITKIWTEVLEREWIGKDENFFEAGGSSLHAVEIIEQLEKTFGKEISVVDLFDNPTIALFAKRIEYDSDTIPSEPSEPQKDARVEKIFERRQRLKKVRGL